MENKIDLVLGLYREATTEKATYDNKKTGTTFSQLAFGNDLAVSIKGSDTQKIDWIRNILSPFLALVFYVLSFKNIYFLPFGVALGIVHYGFLLGAIEVYRNIDRTKKNYYLFGFSLGGGIVIVLAMILFLRGKKVNIITAGSPRPFNVFSVFYWASYLLKAVHFINKGDIVPHTPPVWLGFHNAGRKIKPSTQYKHEDRNHAFELYEKMIKDSTL